MSEGLNPTTVPRLELHSAQQKILVSLTGKCTGAGAASVSVKVCGHIDDQSDVWVDVSGVGNIESILAFAIRIDRQSVGVGAVVGISHEEFVLRIIRRGLRQGNTRAAKNKQSGKNDSLH